MRSLVLSLAAAATADGVAVTPIEQVLSLLEKLQSTVEDEGKTEAKAYDKYACFCKEQATTKYHALTKGNRTSDDLDADSTYYQGIIDDLSGADGKIPAAEAAHQNHTYMLGNRTEDWTTVTVPNFKNKTANLKRAVSNVKLATEAIKTSMRGMTDTHMGESYALVQSLLAVDISLTGPERKAIELLEQEPKEARAHGYKFHGGKIVDLLEKLYKNLKEKLGEEEADHFKAKKQYDALNLVDKIGIRTNADDLAEYRAQLGATESQKQECDEQKRLQDRDNTDNQAFLDDLTAKCEQKATDFDQRSTTRAGELASLADAISELQANVTSNFQANKKLNLFAKTKHAAIRPVESSAEVDGALAVATSTELVQEDDDDLSFVQMTLPEQKVAKYLAHMARELKSAALTTLTVRLNSKQGKNFENKDPFIRVRGLIDDLIARLEEEKATEKKEEDWCKDQMTNHNTETDTQQAEKEKQQALINKLESQIAADKQDKKDRLAENAECQHEIKEGDELREAEHKENERVERDSRAGKAGTDEALRILNTFYSNNKDNFLQRAPGYQTRDMTHAGAADKDGNTVDEMTRGFGAASGNYKGKQNESKGIISLLEVISADFDRTVTTTVHDENVAAGAWDTTRLGLNTTISTNTGMIDNTLEPRIAGDISKLEDARDDLKTATDTLTDLMDTFNENIKARCVDGGVDAKERFDRRKGEIEALKNALEVLRGVDVDLPGTAKIR